MDDKTEEVSRGQWDLDMITAAQFLKQIATVFETQAPAKRDSWIEISFVNDFNQQRIMKLWMEGERDDDTIVH
jgi:hypothetical protein